MKFREFRIPRNEESPMDPKARDPTIMDRLPTSMPTDLLDGGMLNTLISGG